MKRLCAIAVVVLTLLAGGIAAAQDDAEGPDYGAWEALAGNAEAALADASTTTNRLSALREELYDWRTRFRAAEEANAQRVTTLNARIEALGPPPDSAAGETEPSEIAKRRRALRDELADASVPRVRATEARNRADGLIAETDTALRERQTRTLLRTAPSPLNPANWSDAANAILGIGGSVLKEVDRALVSSLQRERFVNRAPLTVALAAIAALLLVRGRRWMALLTDLVQGRRRRHGRVALGFLVSFTQVVLPAMGISLLVAALLSLGVWGEVGEQILRGLVRVVVTIFGTLWIASRVFPLDDALPPVIGLDPDVRRTLRRHAILIGTMLAVGVFVSTLGDLPQMAQKDGRAAVALVGLPIFAGLGWGFFLLARALGRGVRARRAEDETGFGLWALGILARLLMLLAVAGPVAAVAGYIQLAVAVMYPATLSLGLLGLVIALQWPIRDLYAWITRTDIAEAPDALIPVLVNFALAFAAVPLLALIWGMHPDRLRELSTRFFEGVAMGGTRVTPGDIATVILVFAMGYIVTRLLQGALKSTVLPRTSMDAGARNAVTSFIGYVGIGLAALLAITAGGIDLTALAVVFGALSVGIGFGLQNVVQNFVAGIILLIERPISEGDWIEVAGNMGIVKDISVRSTTIETFDKTQVIVPNADFISGTVTNWTRGSQIGRAVMTVGVAYGSDTRRVAEILMEITEAHPVVARYPEPGVDFLGFGASSLDFRIRAILRDVNQLLEVQTEIYHQIAARFSEEGIEIPFPQQDLWLRNPETLRAPDASAPESA